MKRGTGIKEMRIRPNDARTRGTYVRRSTAPPHRRQVISSPAHPTVATHRAPASYPLRLLSSRLLSSHTCTTYTARACSASTPLGTRRTNLLAARAPLFARAGSPDPGSWVGQTSRTSEHQGQRQGKAGHLSAVTHVKLSALGWATFGIPGLTFL
jgi:hypothetical protein